jgi:hypothetical protein
MKAKADTWAHETPNLKRLPEHVRTREAVHALKTRAHKGR